MHDFVGHLMDGDGTRQLTKVNHFSPPPPPQSINKWIVIE